MPRTKKPDGKQAAIKAIARGTQKEKRTLVEVPHSWEDTWWGMPEFTMGNAQPQRQIIISFMTREAVDEFAKIANLPITDRTRSIWFPETETLDSPAQWRYVTNEK